MSVASDDQRRYSSVHIVKIVTDELQEIARLNLIQPCHKRWFTENVTTPLSLFDLFETDEAGNNYHSQQYADKKCFFSLLSHITGG